MTASQHEPKKAPRRKSSGARRDQGANSQPARILYVSESGVVDSWTWEAWLSRTADGSYSAELAPVVDETADDGELRAYQLSSFRVGQELFDFLESSWLNDHEDPLEEAHWSEIVESIRPFDIALAEEVRDARERWLKELDNDDPEPATAMQRCIAAATWKRTTYSGGGAMWAAIGESQRGRAAIASFVQEYFKAHNRLPSSSHQVRVASERSGVFDALVQFPEPD